MRSTEPSRRGGAPNPRIREIELRNLGLEILAGTRRAGAHASELFAEAFRQHRHLTAEQRGALVERVHAVLRSERLLDFALQRAASSELDGRRLDFARWLARAVLDGETRPEEARDDLPRIDWAAVLEAPRRLRELPDPILRLAIDCSLPDFVAERLIADLGEKDAAELGRALSESAPQTLRANRLRITRAALSERLREHGATMRDGALAADALIVEEHAPVFRWPEFTDGLFEMQDEGSQLVSEFTAPPPGGWVVDACAGAGGKTLHLGALLGGRGRIAALGVGAGAAASLEELKRRAKRAGLNNVRTLRLDADGETDAATIPAALESMRGRADRVLVDAPCSGLGVLRRNPEARLRATESDIARLAALQISILERFAPLVKPGGRLVYATCSILKQENDDVVRAFLEKHAEFSLMTAKEILGSARAADLGDGEFLRLYPHRQGTDGFFAAALRRTKS